MTVRKYNFTGRHRIEQADVAIAIHSSSSAFWFSAEMELGRYRLPEDALVFVDAYRQAKRVRFEFGTVKHLRPPPEDERHLGGQFPVPDVVLFRVNVVNPANGMILAQADQINPNHGNSKESLLPVSPEDLERVCWKVHFDIVGSERPELHINENIHLNCHDAASSPEFRALVYPAVLREILNHIFRVEKKFHVDDDDNWCSLWLRLTAEKFNPDPLPSKDGEGWKIDEWINNAVAGYSRSVHALRTYGEVGNES